MIDLPIVIYCFGILRGWIDDNPLNGFLSNKVRALFVYLSLHSDIPISHSVLMNLLWNGCAEGDARESLQFALNNLQQLLKNSEHLEITLQSVTFHSDRLDLWCDALEMDRLANLNRVEPNNSAFDNQPFFEEIAKQEFLVEFEDIDSKPFLTWLADRRRYYRQLVIENLLQHLQRSLRLNERGRGRMIALRLFEYAPFNESVHCIYMGLLAADGERTAVSSHYQLFKQRLKDELHALPALTTEAFAQTIRNGKLRLKEIGKLATALSVNNFTVTDPPHITQTYELIKHNLPRQFTTLIGRKQELTEIVQILRKPETHLLCLIGEGGIGKTSLALATGWWFVREGSTNVESRSDFSLEPLVQGTKTSEFPDGIWFVSLVGVRNRVNLSNTIAQKIAIAMNLPINGQRTFFDQLSDTLRQRRLLLILDCLEHLADSADVINKLLRQTIVPKVLITSRRVKNFQCAVQMRLGGIFVPTQAEAQTMTTAELAQVACTALFVDCAKRAAQNFELTSQNVSDILRICRFVGGSPLGIELAAGLTRSQTCSQIWQNVKDDFSILATTYSDWSVRHRSLKAVLDNSWLELSEQEAQVIVGCAVIENAFTLDAALAITDDSMNLLQVLVEHSFLFQVHPNRFDIHPFVRQYIRQLLIDDPQLEIILRHRHANYYAALAGFSFDELLRSPDKIAFVLLEIENVKSAWRWSIKHKDSKLLFKLLGSLTTHYVIHGSFFEGWQFCAETIHYLRHMLYDSKGLDVDTKNDWSSILGAQLVLQGYLSLQLGIVHDAEELFIEAIEITSSNNDEYTTAQAYVNLFHLAVTQGDLAKAWAHIQNAQTYSQRGRVYSVTLQCQLGQALLFAYQAHYPNVLAYAEEILNGLIEHQYKMLVGYVYTELAQIYMIIGDWAKVNTNAQQALLINQTIGKSLNSGSVYERLAESALAVGDYPRAFDYVTQAIEGNHLNGSWAKESRLLLMKGIASKRLQKLEQSIDAFEQALRLAKQIGDLRVLATAYIELGNALMQKGNWYDAEQNICLVLQMADPVRQTFRVAAETGLVRLRQAQGRHSNAFTYAKNLLPILSVSCLDSIYDAVNASILIYQVLDGVNEPYGKEILIRAFHWICTRAMQISDDQARERFMNCVPEHKLLTELAGA